jgi:tetratricopeptide (TPR) repeat protein
LLFKDLGNIEAKKNHFQKALSFYKKSLENLEEVLPDMIHKSTSATLNDMANICITFKKYQLADEYLQKALKINQELISGQESVEISTNYHTWGNLYAH